MINLTFAVRYSRVLFIFISCFFLKNFKIITCFYRLNVIHGGIIAKTNKNAIIRLYLIELSTKHINKLSAIALIENIDKFMDALS